MEQLKQLNSHGQTITYRIVTGDTKKPALVLIHGLASNATRWTEFIEQTGITASMDVIRPDLTGHGLSRCRTTVNHRVWCRDLNNIIEHEGYKRFIFVGHSLGAQTAIHFGHSQYHKPLGIILIDPIFPQFLNYPRWVMVAGKILLPAAVFVIRLLNKMGIHRKKVPILDLQQLDITMRELMANGDAKIAEHYTSPRRDMQNNLMMIYLQDLLAVMQPLPWPLRDIPMVALFSKHSSVTDGAATQKLLKQSGVEVHEIEADHWPLTEAPKQTREFIEDWSTRLLTADE